MKSIEIFLIGIIVFSFYENCTKEMFQKFSFSSKSWNWIYMHRSFHIRKPFQFKHCNLYTSCMVQELPVLIFYALLIFYGSVYLLYDETIGRFCNKHCSEDFLIYSIHRWRYDTRKADDSKLFLYKTKLDFFLDREITSILVFSLDICQIIEAIGNDVYEKFHATIFNKFDDLNYRNQLEMPRIINLISIDIFSFSLCVCLHKILTYGIRESTRFVVLLQT